MTTIESHDDECVHGIFPPSSCTYCNGRDAREKLIARSFPARFPGRLSCGHTVSVGDIIFLVGDDYVCEDCGDLS